MRMWKRMSTAAFGAAAAMTLLAACGAANAASDVPAAAETQEQAEAASENSIAETEAPAETEAAPEPEPAPTEPMAAEEPDYEAVYAPVLQETLELIQNGYDDEKEYTYISDGLMEEVMYKDTEELLSDIRYVIMDVSGDGIPELLIGKDDINQDGTKVSYIFSGYTVKDNAPYSFVSGWVRSAHMWMGDDHFCYRGSNGAMSTLFGDYHLSADGTEIIWDDFYFSDEVAEGKAGFFHNTTGVYDRDASEELEMSDADFWDLMERYQPVPLSWTSIGNAANS